ncbi:Na(+)-translocating NADH-quinone reductase subunit F [Shimia sp. SK013]|uniref:ASKHA domain-containing protein n=1 Tax=Shimia sp. SK013 TaxID=1389006 RepID=UPI0006B5F74A|nr:ASKHA domain-containing protein [Shimia sp. SK013]KPA22511.1 Na(+)-translocating NADH-quinone reductase subunit F [Shimia sp. SK013]
MSSDPLVIFTPSGKRGHFPIGTPILTAARQLGVDLDSVCGGRGICSKCQITPSYGEFPKHGVTVAEGALSDWNAVEQRYDDKRGLPKGRRLGCQAAVQGDIVIDVPPESQVHKQVVRKRAEVRDITLNPTVKLTYVEVEEPDMHKPSGDLERLLTALKAATGHAQIDVDTHLLRALQSILRKGAWTATAAIHQGRDDAIPRLIALWPGFYDQPLFGLAVDLGSTTIAGHLCNLETGEVVASSGLMNPQIRFGEDLMSRVSYAMMNKGGDLEMTEAVRAGLNQLVTDIASDAEIDKTQILDSVFVMNPVMHHLFLGIDPFELGQAPFALATSDAMDLNATDLGLDIAAGTRAYLLPCIAGHVGADAAGVALSEAPNKSDDLALVVDVGTNAEILLGDKDGVMACSSPTGPAFEGAQISSGQRAAPGAIERVEIDPVTKEPRFRVIGSELWSDEDGFDAAIATTGVTGICGSGIIEVIAEMRVAGLVDASGLIGSAEQTGTDRCFLDGRTNSYRLWNGDEDQKEITVTNGDIRAIQMAKAALYSGARLLMDKRGVNKVDRVVLAGAFGAHISAKHAMVLGMIPDCPLNKVTSAGNAAGTGARIALLNRAARTEIETLVRQIEKIETAVEPRFQEHFVNASALPNSADPFPILRDLVTLPDVSFNTGGGDGATGGRRRRRRG